MSVRFAGSTVIPTDFGTQPYLRTNGGIIRSGVFHDRVRYPRMLTCPKCHAGVPEGMRFCLQCGAALTVVPTPAEPPRPAARVTSPPMTAAPYATEREVLTVPLKIAPTPVIAPRAGASRGSIRPSLGDPGEEIDEEAFKKFFERPITHPGAVLCRFCKSPLDLAGDFCDQCGAPVPEAAPPGVILPKPPPAAAPLPSASPALPAAKPVQAASPAFPPRAPLPGAAPAQPPAAHPVTPPTLPAGQPPSGLVSHLKKLFKKG